MRPRRGMLAPTMAKTLTLRQRLTVQAIDSGLLVDEVARMFGVSRTAIHHRLARARRADAAVPKTTRQRRQHVRLISLSNLNV